MKTTINEKLGIPNNIGNVANNIFDGIIDDLELKWDNTINENVNYHEIKLGNTFNFGNVENNDNGITLNGFKIVIFFRKIKDQKDVGFINMVSKTSPLVNYNDKFRKRMVPTYENTYIKIELTTPEVFTFQYLIDFFMNKEDYYIKIISHELEHLLENIKIPLVPTFKTAEYSSTVRLTTNIKPINKFFEALYYTHDFEKNTRNVEIFMDMHGQNMSAPQYMEFLNKNETYKKLLDYKKFNFNNDVVDELKNYIPNIKGELGLNNIEITGLTNEILIDEYLFALYEVFKNNTLKNIRELLNLPDNTTNTFYITQKTTYNKKNYTDFFIQKQNEIISNAKQTIDKIHKMVNINAPEERKISDRLNDFKNKTKPTPNIINNENINKKSAKKIYITENQLEMIKKNNSLEIFEKEVRKFLYNLITNSNEKISEYWQLNGVSKQKLISTLFGYYIIEKDKKTNEIKVPKYNFERKVKRMYYEIFPNKPITIMHEDGEGATTCDGSSGAFEQPVFQIQRRKFN